MSSAAIPPAVLQAETAIEKKDYAAAERLLTSHTTDQPNDFRAWYDLGFVYKVTQREGLAIDAYKRSLAANADEFDTNMNLGELLLATGKAPEALPYLLAATRLKDDPQAFLLKAAALEDTDPAGALEAYRHSLALRPGNLDAQIRIGALLEKADKPAESEAAYKAALAIDPAAADALIGLVNLYTASGRLPEAESTLRGLIRVRPEDTTLRVQLVRVLFKSGKNEEATTELEAAYAAHPQDLKLLRELAAAQSAARRFDAAQASYARLVESYPQDVAVRLGFANALMHNLKYAEAEREFVQALKLDSKNPEALGNLALCSSQNKHYAMAIQALDMRAALAAETPATLFLRATAYDNLRAYKPAAEYYKKFLEVAAGRYPDQEFQARHRLIAIEPKNK
ncbi:MAG: tetratricopeptide repeat protein [Acidobacteriales bacterium]|nr:tetratricopeptide repeat protein [Terriglobales bacterium]